MPFGRDLAQTFPPVAQQLLVIHRANQDVLRALDLQPLVVPLVRWRPHVLAYSRAGRRILEPPQELIGTAVVGPGRCECGQRIAPRRVRIGIGCHIHALSTPLLDALAQQRHAAEVSFAGDLEVKDLDGDLCLAPYTKGLLQRCRLSITLITHVRGIDAAVTRCNPGERDELLGAGIRCGRILQGGGEPHRALMHALFHQILHLAQLVPGRSAIGVADDHFAHGSSSDIRREIDPDALLLQPRKVFRQRMPVDFYPVVLIGRAVLAQHGVVERCHRFALTGNLGGDTLEYLGRSPRIHQQSQL